MIMIDLQALLGRIVFYGIFSVPRLLTIDSL